MLIARTEPRGALRLSLLLDGSIAGQPQRERRRRGADTRSQVTGGVVWCARGERAQAPATGLSLLSTVPPFTARSHLAYMCTVIVVYR